MSSPCNCGENCAPCEMHGFCHLCREEQLMTELDLARAWARRWKAAAKIERGGSIVMAGWLKKALGQRDSARAWARRWKRLAKVLWERIGVLEPWE